MAGYKRNATEVKADRLYVLKLKTAGGLAMKYAPAVHKALNAKRIEVAESFAREIGGTEEEIHAAGLRSVVSEQTVRRDIRAVDEGLKRGQLAGSALLIDQQMDQVKEEIEKTLVNEEEIYRDLALSRGFKQTQTRGVPHAEDGQGRKIETVEVVERQRDGSGSPALWMVLIRNAQLRIQLREELLGLQYGRVWFANRPQEATFKQRLVDMSDPQAAQQAVQELYDRELQALMRAETLELGPMPPELLAAERLRVQMMTQRLKDVRSLVVATRARTGTNAAPEDRVPGYQLTVTRVPVNGK